MGAWLLWKLRPPALIHVLGVQLAAAVVIVIAISTSPKPDSAALARFAVLAGAAMAVIVATSVWIRVRRVPRQNPWTIHMAYTAAGALTLPPNLMVLLLLGPALHAVLDDRPAPHRWLFTTAATALSAFGARLVLGWHVPQWSPLLVLLAGTVLLGGRALLVGVGLRLRAPNAPVEQVVGEPADVLLGIVAACFGGLLAVAVLREPVAVLLGAPPLALLDVASQLPRWRRSAERDAKTGLANSLHWERLARARLAKAVRRRRPTAMLLLDLDHFKRVNDEYGHLAGDTVLAAVGRTLRSSVRKEDIVGRFGGEEFVVLLPEADAEIACAVAQRVRTATERMSVPTRDTYGQLRELSGLTISIGVATAGRFGYELSELIVAADAALLAAKSGGRNAVTMA